MKYIVITSKHHDGFCLFDSAHTDYDVMSTPFKRDILKELADACRREGLKMCWYHSIMDWHHPDYLPRRGWEKRPSEEADYDRYVTYMKDQLRELVGNYGDIGVLWFDGEWEGTWTHDRGLDLYEFVRGLQSSIIINNRVDTGRKGMEGLTEAGKYAGDFGTPEQQIPPTGLPGVDWETCMTMNNHWGYNKNDHNWKSTADLIRKLADIASKGGNFLLNVGPTAEGLFPEPCLERLAAVGAWMRTNGESIYGTEASPFASLDWGRCTVKRLPGGTTRLYLHVFHWPSGGKLVVPKLDNDVHRAWLLSGGRALTVSRSGLDWAVALPQEAPDPIDTVVVLEIEGPPVVIEPPAIEAESFGFVFSREVRLTTDVNDAEIRYTLDGRDPSTGSLLYSGPIRLTGSATLKAGLFRNGRPLSAVRAADFTKVVPRPASAPRDTAQGLCFEYHEGDWSKLPDFESLAAVKEGFCENVSLVVRGRDEHFGLRFSGYVEVPATGLYTFFVDSDDGSRLFIGDELVVDNDGLHSAHEVGGEIALEAGLHPVTIDFFQRTGGITLDVSYSGPGIEKQSIPARAFFRDR
jgi:alpha-L-fucosidase